MAGAISSKRPAIVSDANPDALPHIFNASASNTSICICGSLMMT